MENKLLESFIAYCKAHPDERFWQALRNWSGVPFLYAHKMSLLEVHDSIEKDGDGLHYFYEEAKDTFYSELQNPLETKQ